MPYCRDTSLVKHLADVQVVHPLKCRCWTCEECAPERQKDLRGMARRGEPNRFLTLTVRAGDPAHVHRRAQELRHAWLLLRRRLLYHKGWKHLPFLAVFERTKRGEPHLHIMLRCGWIDQKYISEVMAELIDAPMVNIQAVTDAGRVAYYVSKYIAKDPHKFAGCKRYWRSQDYELDKNKYHPPEADPLTYWEVRAARPYVVAKLAETDGATVEYKDGKWYIYRNRPPDTTAARQKEAAR